MFNLTNCLILSAVLFAIGAYGVLARRNLLVVLMSVELMLNAANLTLLSFSRWFAGGGAPGGSTALAAWPSATWVTRAPDAGHIFVLISMAIAACEVAVGLALLIALFRVRQTVSTAEVAELRG